MDASDWLCGLILNQVGAHLDSCNSVCPQSCSVCECICVCVHVRVGACGCACMHVCMYVCVYVCICVQGYKKRLYLALAINIMEGCSLSNKVCQGHLPKKIQVILYGTKLWLITANKHFGRQSIGGLAALYSKIARIEIVGGLVDNLQIHQSSLLPKFCAIRYLFLFNTYST